MSITVKEDTGLHAEALRKEVSKKYREVATDPAGSFHFHTGRYLARHLGYDEATTASLPDAAVESFAGVANVFSMRPVQPGERVVDIGSGAGFDCFVAARLAGPRGNVVGVDMTDEMLAKSQATARDLGMANVEFRKGLAERLPVDDSWADVVMSNGVINLCPDKRAAFSEILRVLRPGGWLEFADIANGSPVPEAAVRNIDLWTA
jgi:SAM-dependent methyltransferase